MHTLFHIASAICFLEKATRIGAQTCYFPDGSAATRDTPCRALSSNQASACCGYSDLCLDNGLCYGHGVVSRGTCTDQSWQSGECAQTCRDCKFSTMICEEQEIPRLLAPCIFPQSLRISYPAQDSMALTLLSDS